MDSGRAKTFLFKWTNMDVDMDMDMEKMDVDMDMDAHGHTWTHMDTFKRYVSCNVLRKFNVS
jgi:hypothetical protein